MIKLGLYSGLEGKWYDFLDALDRVIPVYAIINPIEKVVPSFPLFIVVLILVILGLFFFLGGGLSFGSYSLELTVLDKNGDSVSDALVELTQTCENSELDNLSVTTNDEGKAFFEPCGQAVEIKVTKANFTKFEGTVYLPEDSKKKVTLSELIFIDKKLKVTIVDDVGDYISKAKLSMACIRGGSASKTEVKSPLPDNYQPSGGFEIDVNGNCEGVRLEATASGYETKTVSVLSDETTKTIKLEKIIQNGNANFATDSPIGPQVRTEILISGENNFERTLITLIDGSVEATLPQGHYTYSAIVKGFVETGNFDVTANETTDVSIYFSELINNINDDPTNPEVKSFYLKLVDGNTGVNPADLQVFVLKGNDVNKLRLLKTDRAGIIQPSPINDTNGKTYKGLAKAEGYKKKPIDVEVRTFSQGPQNVTMQQGGATLTLKIVDDLNAPIKEIVPKIYFDDFDGVFDLLAQTSTAGITTYRGLPNGNYIITASTAIEEGSLSFSVNGTDLELTLVLSNAKGKLDLAINDEYEKAKVEINYAVEKKFGDEFSEVFKGISFNGDGNTPLINAGSYVRILIDEPGFLPYESFVYRINRTTSSSGKDKTMFLKKKSSLPNQKELQMMLREIYSSNPITTSETVSNILQKGKRYYLLFDLVLNNNQSLPVTISASVEPTETALSKGMRIQSGYSVNGSTYVLSSQPTSFLADTNLVDADAKKINIVIPDANGPKVIPVLIEFTLDANATGKQKLFWKVKQGANESLQYSKEFEVDKAICMPNKTTCPDVMFLNYLNWNNKGWVLIDDSTKKVQLGDTYAIKTIAQNMGDKEIGTVNLTEELTASDAQYFNLIDNGVDKNSMFKVVNVKPLELTDAVVTTLNLKKVSGGGIGVKQSLRKPGTDQSLLALKGNPDTGVRLQVQNKKFVQIKIFATNVQNTIYEGGVYPYFFVKTTLSETVAGSGYPVRATWSAKLEGSDTYLPSMSARQTDENGIEVTSFDASNLKIGDRVVFEAIDENNSIPVKLTVTVKTAIETPPEEQPECLKVMVDGRDVTGIEFPTKEMDVSMPSSISVFSACEENRDVGVLTDLQQLSPTRFIINPNTMYSISLDANDVVTTRKGMLGVYPVQVIAFEAEKYHQVDMVDMIVRDRTAPFDINYPIFDFRQAQTIASKIINKKYAGRQDVYLPRVEMDEPGIEITYRKNGVPRKINFKIQVETKALEAITIGYLISQGLTQTKTGSSCAGVAVGTFYAPGANESEYFKLRSELSSVWSGVVSKFQNKGTAPRTDTTALNRSRTVPFYSLPKEVQSEIISTLYNESGSSSSVTGSGQLEENEKVAKASFALQDLPLSNNTSPVHPVVGAIYETYPDVIGQPNVMPRTCYEVRKNWTLTPLPTLADYDIVNNWNTVIEDSNGRLFVESINKCTYCDILSFGYFDSQSLSSLVTTNGSTLDNWYGGHTNNSGTIKLRHELIRIMTPVIERTVTWDKNVEIIPQEGKIYDLGDYSSSVTSLIQKWPNSVTYNGRSPGDVWTEGTTRVTYAGSINDGFIPFSWAKKNGVGYAVPDVNIPSVEFYGADAYGTNQWKYSKIKSIPAEASGVRLFLNNKHLYGEYIGTYKQTPTGYVIDNRGVIDSNVIDFNITRAEFAGSKYAIIKVTDWVSGTQKVTRSFQVRLVGSEANCYSPEGYEGVSGAEFQTRLMYDWDWAKIAQNQCDLGNMSYTYCDGAQFSVSLMKKLMLIDNLLKTGAREQIPTHTSFYSYLIKDNYSQGLLDDFDEYYSGGAFTTIGFNTVGDNLGFDQFISENKISFRVRDAEGNVTETGQLPSGGIYRVEIDFNLENQNINSLMKNDGPNARIIVTFSKYASPQTNNPFYEIPFDGELGKVGNTYGRREYGIGISDLSLKLNSAGTMALPAANPMKSITYVTSEQLDKLKNGAVLYYNELANRLEFYPQQPTPVVMSVTGAPPTVTAEYDLLGFDRTTPMKKEWIMKSSTIGDKCTDFSGERKLLFNETVNGTKRTISWTNTAESGKVNLATIFFTAPNKDTSVTRQAGSTVVELKTTKKAPGLVNGPSIKLSYYDTSGIIGYDSLQWVFDQVKAGNMCMTKDPKNEIRVWWRPTYLDSLIKDVDVDVTSCGE